MEQYKVRKSDIGAVMQGRRLPGTVDGPPSAADAEMVAMDEAAIRERLRELAIELDTVRAEIQGLYAQPGKLGCEQHNLIDKLTGIILADGGCDEEGELLTTANL